LGSAPQKRCVGLVLTAALAVTPTYADEQSGVASTFCDKVTATGGMDCDALVAASPGLPFGTMVTVVHNGQSEVVKIIDRGPAVWTHRVIDLSTGAGRGISLEGLGAVSLTWDATIVPLPLFVAPTVVPFVAPVVLVVLHRHQPSPDIRESGVRRRVTLPSRRHR
jgi:Lytic transglycolase